MSDEEILELMKAEHLASLPPGTDPNHPFYDFNEELAKAVIQSRAGRDTVDDDSGPSFNDIIERIQDEHLASVPSDVDPCKLFVANLPFPL